MMAESLSIRDGTLTNIGKINFFSAALKTLCFGIWDEEDDDLVPIDMSLNLDFCPHLTTLLFYGRAKIQRHSLDPFLMRHPQLQDLQLDSMHHLSSDILPLLSQYCPNLRSVGLSDNGWVTDESIFLLAGEGCSNLKSLSIAGTGIRHEDTIRRLISVWPNLCFLGLSASNNFPLLAIRLLIIPVLDRREADDQCRGLAIKCLIYYVLRQGLMFAETNSDLS
jgi:hypothetical protein